MPLNPNNQILVDTLKSATLDARFERIELANFNAMSDVKRGCFSIVFRAHDTVDNKDVAVKFYDLSVESMQDEYRRQAFRREPEILSKIVGIRRCLQIVAPLKQYRLRLLVDGGTEVEVPTEYFVQEWISDDLDCYFLEQELFTAEEKLLLFNEIVLAVEALHAKDISHRDLKFDNLRMRFVDGERTVVVIDFGTAAHLTTPHLQSRYEFQAGHYRYAAPEARCGLAGNRELARYCDYYALGCMLFELFHRDQYFVAHQRCNVGFDIRLNAMRHFIAGVEKEDAQVEAWQQVLAKFALGVAGAPLNEDGTSAPPAIRALIQELIWGLTHIDFRKRPNSLSLVRNRVWTAIRILRSETEQRIRLERAKAIRAARLEKLKRKEATRALMRLHKEGQHDS